VSCHYVVDDDGRIVQMVAESDRAWHAGASFWAGETDINSASIGIEIQNPGHQAGYPDFPEAQMRAVIALSKDIIARHAIPAARVLAHSDVAPARKIDPGEKFDWPRLAAAGIGHWISPAPHADDDPVLNQDAPAVVEAQSLLAAYGYGVERNGIFDEAMRSVVGAFQLHFRPARVAGDLDRSTLDTLRRLLEALPVA
jgi:N-acetylmuramoyl-L-alanine amidase